jgi:ADP-dependent NAD(P)H-hydrate dehydratase
MPQTPSKPLTLRLLQRLPLPLEAHDGKDGRGVVLTVGGAPQMPGAIVLTATAALRAGAGKLQIATARSVAAFVGVAVPEAYVLGVEETADGGLAPNAVAAIAKRADGADAVVIGPGMVDERGSAPALEALLERLDVPVVVDAAALSVLKDRPRLLERLAGRAVLTPHCGEMATLLGRERDEIEGTMARTAADAAARFGAVVALKDDVTYIATPDGENFIFRGGTVGLATSGSGDVLAGVIGGLLARGCAPLQATLWGVYTHAAAGTALGRRIGVGFLARELLGELPRVLRKAGAPQRVRSSVQGLVHHVGAGMRASENAGMTCFANAVIDATAASSGRSLKFTCSEATSNGPDRSTKDRICSIISSGVPTQAEPEATCFSKSPAASLARIAS